MADTSDDAEKAAQVAEAIDEIGVDRLSSLLVAAYEDHVLDDVADTDSESNE